MVRSSRLGYVMLAITASLLAVMNLRSSVFSVSRNGCCVVS